jgi:hypothetical protein
MELEAYFARQLESAGWSRIDAWPTVLFAWSSWLVPTVPQTKGVARRARGSRRLPGRSHATPVDGNQTSSGKNRGRRVLELSMAVTNTQQGAITEAEFAKIV